MEAHESNESHQARPDSHQGSGTPAGAVLIRRPRKRCLRWILLACVLAGFALLARPTWHLLRTAWNDIDGREPPAPGFIDDASRLNLTPVADVWSMPGNDRAEAERELAALLERAREENLRVSIAGTRHSMGGHTIYPGGISIDMLPFNQLEYDASRQLLHAGAGARWSEVIAYLEPLGLSVAIMQSDNTFSIGGSLSVNCHGWTYGRPPVASTVESFRLMLADGEVVRCSRTENSELFSAVLGGYGLFGIILDVELHVVPNERYRLTQYIVPIDQALPTFEQQVRGNPKVAMAYARMNISPPYFMNNLIINVLVRDPAPDGSCPALAEPGLTRLRRGLFRGSEQSDYGKKLRWAAETKLQPHLSGRHFSRNQLLNESSAVFENRSATSTDILHEYFVPQANLAHFVQAMRRIIPHHHGNLMNVTIREIETDHDTFLRYADQPVLSFVMLFAQERSPAGDAAMEAMTQELIDAALTAGGRYYLPYRLHATQEQFERAYPQAAEFFALKRKYDPQELFQNQFYLKYGQSPQQQKAASPGE